MSESEITQLRTMQEVLEHIQQKFPGWIVNMYDAYSNDYTELNENWKKVCDIFKAQPQRIILVENLKDDEHFSFAELLTQSGFVVRTVHEFGSCPVCNKVIPKLNIYNKLKELKKQIPHDWSDKCIDCS